MRARAEAVCLVEVITLTLLVRAGAFGFCLDHVPPALQGTGFAGSPSRYPTQLECLAAGHSWCPLSNETDTWEAEGGSVEYYWFSACCSGRQSGTLLPDPVAGVPTCEPGKPSEQCTRTHWQQKVLQDLLNDDVYNFKVAPTTVPMPGMRAPGHRGAGRQGQSCVCEPSDPRCENGTDTQCLVCRTRQSCSDDAVSVGIHVFKLHTIDLKTSLLAFSAWLRESWSDPRLSYNIQCYGGLDYFEAIAQSGSMENSMIWTPDLELYNGEETIWQGSIQAHLALVYPCTGSGKPTRSTCGSVFWSRPGLLKALCLYKGLLSFPLDQLTCKLEIAGFMLDGRYQDVALRSIDDGISWTGKEGVNGFVGLTSGTSFQDYRLQNITTERYVVAYDCCPDSPYPTLIWTIRFTRSHSYYVLRLIFPAIILTCLSFITFWMNPEIGERLGFNITVILAMFTNDVVAAGMMPVANERLLMDYLSLGCSLFGFLSLLETGIVLFLYHSTAENLRAALVPDWLRRFSADPAGLLHERFCRTPEPTLRQTSFHVDSTTTAVEKTLRRRLSSHHLTGELSNTTGKCAASLKESRGSTMSKDMRIRRQLYRQIFCTVDADFSGSLQLDEVSDFAQFMFGDKWDPDQAQELISAIDTNGNGLLGFNEFAVFCDMCLPHIDDLKFMNGMVDGFLQIVERKRMTRTRMWQERAKSIDQFCRWTIPPGFFLFLAVLFTRSEAGFEHMVESKGVQFWLMFSGYIPLIIAITAFVLYKLHRLWLRYRSRRLNKSKTRDVTMVVPEVVMQSQEVFDTPVPMGCNRASLQDKLDRTQNQLISDEEGSSQSSAST
mmetsp:Transcript_64551/g.188851  ORF Transcript_64551/g.188851 Transcript_64551/m.188851 type:complete len:832 (-) Transcript_64551:142-2637(-)